MIDESLVVWKGPTFACMHMYQVQYLGQENISAGRPHHMWYYDVNNKTKRPRSPKKVQATDKETKSALDQKGGGRVARE